MNTISLWLQLLRAPFFSVGVMPLIVSAVFTARTYGVLDVPVFVLSLIAVICVMASANLNGEAFDIIEDSLAAKQGKNAFSGGSQIVVNGWVAPATVKIVSTLCMLSALAIGVVLQFYFHTGFWTLPLGLTGIVAGYFYSKPPLRWVRRGIGEMLIGYCYGWLPVAAGTYIQIQRIPVSVHWMALPIVFSIFNIILINEFPDYDADTQAGKRNLLVRIGRERGVFVYACAVALAGISFVISIANGVPVKGLYCYIPVFMVACWNTFSLFNCRASAKALERTCGLTIVVNLATSASLIAAFL